MFAICIESSHKRGMGHLFRAIQFIKYLEEKNEPYILLLNQDLKSEEILIENKIKYKVVDLQDYISNWEAKIIKEYKVEIWFNDRMQTDIRHARHVKAQKIKLITMDDLGTGANLADLHFAGMSFNVEEKSLKGEKVFLGTDYIILNKEIADNQRVREEVKEIIVTLGGSDTYGVTIDVVRKLKEINKAATILIGPNFQHKEELLNVVDSRFKTIYRVQSLIKEFSKYDLAITGGGVTCIEANASGLPCIIIANEIHEIEIGKYLDSIGSSKFIGYYRVANLEEIGKKLPVKEMSINGINSIALNGIENIYNEIRKEDNY